MVSWWTVNPWDNCWDRRSQPQQLLKHNKLTTNGRRITCNRQHIKPMSVTADAYIQYKATKHIHKQNDPLEDILECIRNNPMAYATPKHYNKTSSQKMNDKQQANNVQQGKRQDPRQKIMNIPREDTGYTHQGNEVVITWYGRTIRKPDRLKYE